MELDCSADSPKCEVASAGRQSRALDRGTPASCLSLNGVAYMVACSNARARSGRSFCVWMKRCNTLSFAPEHQQRRETQPCPLESDKTITPAAAGLTVPDPSSQHFPEPSVMASRHRPKLMFIQYHWAVKNDTISTSVQLQRHFN